MRSARAILDAAMSEAEWERVVTDCAAWNGWLLFHDRDSRKNNPGFPDLVLCHPVRGQMLFAELKTERGKLRAEQVAWRDALLASGARYHLWRPSDFHQVCRVLGAS